jgi:prolipoprotein diacylglyceryltransferase
MGPFLFIINANGDYYYDLFYLFAFLVGYLLLLWIGVKRKYNFACWMLVLASTRFFFIIGTKLFSYSADEWQVLLSAHYFPPSTGKTLLGGLLLVAIGYFLIKRLLHLKNETLDAFALVIPLSIALQRPGCLLAGCCYGNVTTLPWGVQYVPGTLPHYHQFAAGLIQAQELYSLPVHPSQVYEAMNGLLVVGLLLLVKRYIKAPGNTLTCSIILYCCFRFFTEFFRSPLAHASGGTTAGGLKIIQWGLLATICLLGILFVYREKYYKPATAKQEPPPVATMLFILLGLVFTTWGLRTWFTFTELLALNMVLFPAIVFLSIYFFQSFFVPQYRWLALAVLVLPVVLMSQTLPVGKSKDDTLKTKSFHSFKAGFGSGNYQNSHTIGQGSGCDRVSNTAYYKQEYTLGGVGYAITRQREKEEVTYGLNAFSGKYQETDITTSVPVNTVKTTLYGLNPYIRYDRKWFGLGGGLHMGNLRYTLENLDKDGTGKPESGSEKTPVYPQVYLRAGPTRFLFADFHLADQFPSASPGFRHQIGIGSGLGLRNGTFIRYGTTGIDQYLSGHIVLDNRFVVEPLFLWGTSDTPDQVRQRQFSLGLHYRFNHQAQK